MKVFVSVLFTLCILLTAATISPAQSKTKTILLVRHAEKTDATSTDPELSPQGRERAQRLVKRIGKYRPGAFYSTNFKRTRDTLVPLAGKRKKEIQIYDAKKPQELIDQIMKSETKRFVVSGHSNTIPGLANLIAKKDIFKNLDDSEYTVIWLIKMKDGKITRLELLDY